MGIFRSGWRQNINVMKSLKIKCICRKRLAALMIIPLLLALSPTAPPNKAEAAARSVSLPVAMYHHILGETRGAYAVTPEQFGSDLRAYKAAGFTTVLPSEVIAFVRGMGKLPKKPLLITFDDGHYNNYCHALPLLKKHGQRAVFSVIGAFSQFSTVSGDHSNPHYSYLTWEQIADMARSGYAEIGNHSYNLHKYSPRFGVGQMDGESVKDYKNCIAADITRLQRILISKCKVKPKVFAYPFGKYTDESREVLLSLGFEMMLTSNEGINVLTEGKPEYLHYLKRFNRDPDLTSSQFVSILMSGKSAKA